MEPADFPAKEELTKSKIDDALAKIRKNRKIVPQTMDMLHKNPEMQRNAANFVEGLNIPSVMGMETPLRERKKMAARQEMVRSQMRNRLADGEVKCVHMLVKGKLVPYAVNCGVLDQGEKWCVEPVLIGDMDFLYVCDATVPVTNKNLNKRASDILGEPVYGIVAFVLLDKDLEPTDLAVSDFPSK